MSSTTAPPTDRELARQIVLDRSERAFRELYRRHTPRLYQMLLRVLDGKVHDTEDAVQEAWTRAVRLLEGFRWEAAFSTWLTGIALNVARDVLRRRGRRRERVWEEEKDTRVASPPAVGEGIDLERAMALLPRGCRTVLLLHDAQGVSHEEIAGMMGISIGTSKSQLHRARRALRAILVGEIAPDPEVGHA